MLIKIPSSIYKDEALTHEEVVVYTIIKAVALTTVISESVYIDPKMITVYTYGRNYTEHNYKEVRKAIMGLIDENVIHINNNIIDKCDFINREEESFAYVPYDCLYNILTSDNANAMQIAYYFINMVGTINYKTKIGNQSIKYLAELAGVSESTAIKYNKALEDLGVIIINRIDSGMVDGGNIKHFKNKYALAGNIRPSGRETSNEKRSMAARYNNIINNPTGVSELEIREVMNYYSGTEKAATLDDLLLFT